MFKKLISVLSAALILAQAVSAQEAPDEIRKFQTAADGQSVLFRGRAAVSYVNRHFNGTYYWSSGTFLSGDVIYNGRTYYDVLLNIDACAQDLLARHGEGRPSVVLRREYVPSFTMGESRFVNLRLAGYDSMDEGYYEVLSDSPEYVVRRVDKKLRSSVNNVNGAMIGYDDPAYREDIHTFFENCERYYLLRDGRFKRIGRRKALKLSGAK